MTVSKVVAYNRTSHDSFSILLLLFGTASESLPITVTNSTRDNFATDLLPTRVP